MNFEEITRIAKQSGAVRWLRSNRIEFLHWEDGTIYATRVLMKKKVHPIKVEAEYRCEKVEMHEMIPVYQLDWSHYE